MSTTVDNRVVEMRFDNGQFEKNASQSISTLERLKQALKFNKKDSSGLDKLGRDVKNFKLNSISDSVDKLSGRFSNMGIVGITALQRITNAAIDTGKRITSALTIDSVKTGLSEYETKINAIQVIRANDHTSSMAQITAALDELNTYADKTIYNFSQMTSNVGKFVAQGMTAEKAAKAVQGMANLAAASGASPQEMARATYQMSQALGGVIRKIDINSLKNASMWGVDLKDVLMDIARAENVAIDELIAKKGTFEETLEKGWLTGEMFTKAMNIYSGVYDDAQLRAMGFNDAQITKFQKLAETAQNAATKVKTFTQLVDTLKESVQSGWTQSWELIIGDFEEAQKLWTAVSDVLSELTGATAENRNEMLKEWKSLHGRDYLIQSIAAAFQNLLDVISPIKQAFDNIFPPMTGKRLADLTRQIRNFIKLSAPSRDVIDSIYFAAEGLFNLIRFGINLVKQLAEANRPLISFIATLATNAIKLVGIMGYLLSTFVQWLEASGATIKFANGVAQAFSTLGSFIGGVVNVVVELIKAVADMPIVQTIFESIVMGLEKLAGVIATVFGAASGKFSEFITSIKNVKKEDIAPYLERVGQGLEFLWGLLDPIRGAFNDLISSIQSGNATFGSFSSGVTGLWESFKNFLKGGNSIEAGAKSFSVLEKAGKSLATFEESFHAFVQKIVERARELDVGRLIVLAFGTAVTVSFLQLGRAIGQLPKMMSKGIGVLTELKKTIRSFNQSRDSIGDTIIKIAGAIAILAGSVFLLSKIPSEDLGRCVNALLKLMIVFGILAGAAVAISAIDKLADNFQKASTGVLSIAGSVGILAASLKILDGLDPERIDANIISIEKLVRDMVYVALAMSLLPPSSKATALVMIAFALSIYKAVQAVAKLAEFPADKIKAAGDTVAQLMFLLTGLTLAVSKINFGAGASLLAIVASLYLLEGALWAIAKFGVSADVILQNIDKYIIVFGALAGLMAMTRLAGANAKGAGIAALGMGFALLSMTGVIIVMAGLAALNPDALLVGVLGLVGLTAAVGVLMWAISNTENASIKAAAALIPMSLALVLMSGAVRILSGLDLAQLAIGLVGVGILTSFAGALTLLSAIAGKADFKPILAMVAGIIAIAGSLALLSFADVTGLGAAAGTLAAMLLTLGLTMWMISEKAKDIDLKSIASMVVMLGMLAASATALFVLASLPSEGLVSAALALGMLMLAIGGVGTFADVGLKTALALTVLSVALVPMALALKMLEGVQFENLQGGLIGLAVALGILVIAGAAADALSLGLVVLAGVIVAFAASALIFSQAVTQIVNALILFSQNSAMISASIIQTLTSLGVGIQYVFTSIGTGLANMIISFFATIATAIGNGIDSIISVITGKQSTIASTGTSLIGSLAQGILNGLPGPVQAVVSVVDAIGGALSGDGLIGTMFAAGADAVSGLAKGIFDSKGVAEEAGAQLGRSTKKGLSEEVGWHSPWLETIRAGLDAAKGLAKGFLDGKGIAEMAGRVTGAAAGNAAGLSALNAISSYGGPIHQALANMMSGIKVPTNVTLKKKVKLSPYTMDKKGQKKTFKEVAAAKAEAEDLMAGLSLDGAGGGGGGGGGGASEATQEIKKLFDVMEDGGKIVEKFSETFGKAYEKLGFTEPMKIGQEAVKKLADTIYKESVKTVDATTQAAKSQETILAETRDAFIAFYDNVKSAVSGAVDEFGKFSEATVPSVKDWIKNLNNQEVAIKNWQNDIIRLATRTRDFSFMKMIIGYGPEKAALVRNLNAAADEELETLKKKTLFATSDLVTDTTDMMMAALAYTTDDTVAVAEDTAEQVKDTVEEAADDTVQTAKETVQSYVAVNRDGVVQINQEQQKIIKGNEEISKSADQVAKYTKEALSNARKQYAEFHDAVYKAVSSNFDIFEKFNTETELTGDELLENMESQIHGYHDWADGISTLMGRGIHEGLAKQLVDAGEASYERVQAMLQWSEEEINRANSYFEQSLTLAEDLAKQIGQDMATAGLMATQGFVNALDPTAGYGKAKEMAQQTVAAIVTELESGNANLDEIGKSYTEGTGKAIENNTGTVISAAVKSMTDTIAASKTASFEGGEEVGVQYARGVASGISKSSGIISSAADTASYAAIGTFEENWDEHSPSRVGMRLGRFFDIGIADGLLNGARFIESAAEETSSQAIDSMRAVVGHIADIINGEVQIDPTIRPVMDLSNVEAGASAIGSMFGGRSYALTRGVSTINRSDSINDMLSQMRASQASANAFSGQPINIYVYSSPGQSEEEIASLVDQKLMHRINRQEAVWT